MHESVHQSQTPFSEGFQEEGGTTSMAPPAFQLQASAPIQMQEGGSNADSDTSTPLNPEYLDPLLNSNLSATNLQLIIDEWEATGSGDYRQLAYMLATVYSESFHSWQAGNESLADSDWTSTGDDGNLVDQYGPDGVWGHGFHQTTFDYNFGLRAEELGMDSSVEGIPDHLNMDVNRGLANLPTIAADMFANRVYHFGIEQEEGPNLTLNDYFNESSADYEGARGLISTNHAEGIADNATRVYDLIIQWDTQHKDNGVSLVDYLMGNLVYPEGTAYDENNEPSGTIFGDAFDEARNADALRILYALGYLNYSNANLASTGANAEDTAARQHYLDEVAGSGDLGEMLYIDTAEEINALIAFQVDFNNNHELDPPLNEQGVLDEQTYWALTLGGHQIASGEAMIDYAFDGQEQATNLYEAAFARYHAGELDAAGLGGLLLSYMPVGNGSVGETPERQASQTSPQDVINLLAELGDWARFSVCQGMVDAANNPNELSIIDQPILNYMSTQFAAFGADNYALSSAAGGNSGLDTFLDENDATAEQLTDLANPEGSFERVPRYIFGLGQDVGWDNLAYRVGPYLPADHPDKNLYQVRRDKILAANNLTLSSTFNLGVPYLLPEEYWPFFDEAALAALNQGTGRGEQRIGGTAADQNQVIPRNQEDFVVPYE